MDLCVRSLKRLVLAAAIVVLGGGPAAGQSRLTEPPPGPDFLTRVDFHLGASMLGSGDERFAWDTHWGGEFDLVDYVAGRLTLFGDYQAVLGHELQPFDPNQGNYTLTVSSTLRLDAGEAAVVFNHVSRHLGDRPKTFGIAMNVLGGRWLQEVPLGETVVAIRGDVGAVIQNAYVDYTWVAGAQALALRRVNGRLEAYARLNGELTGVDPAIAGRSTLRAGGIESGVRIAGRSGILELFFGFARVIDADPIDRQPQRWALLGFRLLSP